MKEFLIVVIAGFCGGTILSAIAYTILFVACGLPMHKTEGWAVLFSILSIISYFFSFGISFAFIASQKEDNIKP